MKRLYGDQFQTGRLFEGDMACDIETSGLDETDEIYSIGFSNEFGGVVYILDKSNHNDIRNILLQTLLNPEFKYVIAFHNALFDLPFILRTFFPEIIKISSTEFTGNIFDTIIAARYLYSTQYLSHLDLHKRMTYSLKFMVEYYGISEELAASFEETVKGIKIQFADVNKVAEYNYKDCVNTLSLYKKFKLILRQQDSYDYYLNYHFPHAFWNIIHMRSNGIPVNEKRLREMSNLLQNFFDDLSEEIYAQTKKRFNIGSQNEIASAVFNNRFLLRTDGETFIPPFTTGKDSVKVDITTFENLRGASTTPKEKSDLFNKIIAIMETTSALRELNAIEENLVCRPDGFYLYPNQTVSAKSGRIRISKPNAHGQSKKCFKITRW